MIMTHFNIKPVSVTMSNIVAETTFEASQVKGMAI